LPLLAVATDGGESVLVALARQAATEMLSQLLREPRFYLFVHELRE
jgi:hypothetical protein